MKAPFFFFNDTATTEIYTLSLHDALPISHAIHADTCVAFASSDRSKRSKGITAFIFEKGIDRKSTRLNSSHSQISYAVFCLKKKNHLEGCLEAARPRAVDRIHDKAAAGRT